MRRIILALLAVSAYAEAPELKVVEIAKAQRDFVIAKANYEAAATRLQATTAEAVKSCEGKGQIFDPDQITCKEKPKP